MTDKKAEFWLTWFSAKGENLIGEEKLSVTEEQIREWFWLPEDDEWFGCLSVTASQRIHLGKIAKHWINLNKYDYFVEHILDLKP